MVERGPNNLSVRQAQRQEQEQVISLIEDSGLVSDQEEGYLQRLIPNRRILIAQESGKIQGALVIEHTVPQEASINFIVVDPSYENQGIATRLLKEAELSLKNEGIKKIAIVLKTIEEHTPDPKLKLFYEERGWRSIKGFNGTLVEKLL